MDDPLTEERRVERLRPPEGEGAVSMVLDTDAYNEIDDQFAVAFSLTHPEVDVEAVYAAPFHNDRSSGPADGMERSYAELERLLDRLDRSPDGFAFEGSREYLPGASEAVESEAAADLVERAHEGRDGPLYVVAIGTPTNVASALLRDPTIREEVVVVWLGGHPHEWHTAEEFNLAQDVHASRVLFDSGVPLVQIPCRNVAEHVATTVPELEAHLAGVSPVADYLVETFADYPGAGDPYYSKEVWDLAAVAWVADPGLVPSHLAASPVLTDQVTWSHDPTRHLVRVAHHVDRDAVFRTLAANL